MANDIVSKIDQKGEQFMGKIPYNMAKTAVLLSSPAALGIYAGAKILPKVAKAVTSKRALNLYKKAGVATLKTAGKVMGSSLKYTAIGIGGAAYLTGKGIKKGYNYFKNKHLSKKYFKEYQNISNVFGKEDFNHYDDVSNYNDKHASKSYRNLEIEENSNNYSRVLSNNSYREVNHDLETYVKESPEFNDIYNDVMNKLLEKFSEEQLTQMHQMNPEIIRALTRDTMNQMERDNQSGYKINNFKNKVNELRGIDNDVTDNESSEDSQSSSEATHEDLDNTLDIGLNVDNSINPKDIENDIDNSDLDSENNQNNISQEQTNKDIQNILDEATKKEELESNISFDNAQRINDIEDMQNNFEQMEFDLPELSKNTELDNQVDFNNTKSTENEYESINFNSTLENTENTLQNNESKEKMDEIWISKDSRVVFRTEGDKVYQQFDFGGRFSKEKEVTAEDYVDFKKSSLNVSKDKNLEKQKEVKNDYSMER